MISTGPTFDWIMGPGSTLQSQTRAVNEPSRSVQSGSSTQGTPSTRNPDQPARGFQPPDQTPLNKHVNLRKHSAYHDLREGSDKRLKQDFAQSPWSIL